MKSSLFVEPKYPWLPKNQNEIGRKIKFLPVPLILREKYYWLLDAEATLFYNDK